MSMPLVQGVRLEIHALNNPIYNIEGLAFALSPVHGT